MQLCLNPIYYNVYSKPGFGFTDYFVSAYIRLDVCPGKVNRFVSGFTGGSDVPLLFSIKKSAISLVDLEALLDCPNGCKVQVVELKS